MNEFRASAKVGPSQFSLLMLYSLTLATFVVPAIGVIRLIKMFGYERNASEQIYEKREKELDGYKRKIMLNLVNGIYK